MRREHRIPSVLAPLARLGAAAAALALLAACGGRGPPPAYGPSSAEPVTVIVQRGDTVSAIARRHGVPVQPVIAANGLQPPYVIRPGQVLHVPGVLPPPQPVVASLPPPVPVVAAGSASSLGAMEPPRVTASAEPFGPRAVTEEALPPPPGAAPPAAPLATPAAAEEAEQLASLPLPPPPPPALA
ncbi:LysM peptidoglycan-binding domain-containing protein, partial [Elioraea rosea]|uniref:LysM peptidoglycan-binding domain-containing protein n=1 Tax=Elioraea rosea TaxID=2492390 RepID=UPI001185ED44